MAGNTATGTPVALAHNTMKVAVTAVFFAGIHRAKGKIPDNNNEGIRMLILPKRSARNPGMILKKMAQALTMATLYTWRLVDTFDLIQKRSM